MKYFVYLLVSLKDGNFYIGQTKGIVGRLARHNQGRVKSTANRKPFRLVGYAEFTSRKAALDFERNLKLHSDKKLKFIRKFKPDFYWKNKGR